MCGHSHCAEHIVIAGNYTNHFVNGMGHGCCYRGSNVDELPDNSLLFLMADMTTTYAIDDDSTEIGVNGTIGGFNSVVAKSMNMAVTYYNQNGTELYAYQVNPRSRSWRESYLHPTPAPTTGQPVEEGAEAANPIKLDGTIISFGQGVNGDFWVNPNDDTATLDADTEAGRTASEDSASGACSGSSGCDSVSDGATVSISEWGVFAVAFGVLATVAFVFLSPKREQST